MPSVLITGTSSGLGRGTAERLHELGWDVLGTVLDRDDESALPWSTVVCDVTDDDAVAALGLVVRDRFGGSLDALVNNAGIAGPTAACEDVALADWQRTLAVNLTGQFLCAQRAIPLLRASRNASIANLSSAAGRFGFPLRTPYSASKWGVIGLTKSLAIELGPHGVRVNAICPGSVAGPRIDAVFANRAAARNLPVDVVRKDALARTSLRRMVTADDIANAIVFLASPLGANISGQAVPVDADTHSIA